MPTELTSFRIDKKVKKEAQELAREMGTTLSNIINMYLVQFVQEKRIHFKNGGTQDISSHISEGNGDILKTMNNSILNPKPHIQEALQELAEKRQLLQDKKDFGNQKKSEGIPIESTYVFFGTKGEQKFFRIDNSLYPNISESHFFFYEFTKSEHQIIGIPNNLIIAFDFQMRKDELLFLFKEYIENNRDKLVRKYLFSYSRLILSGTDKLIFDAIRTFFDDQNNYIMFKVQNLVDGDPVVVRAENHWVLKEEFFDDKSNETMRKWFISNQTREYGRYEVYTRNSGFNDGISFEILTGKYISSEKEVLELMQRAKRDFNLEEFNLIQREG